MKIGWALGLKELLSGAGFVNNQAANRDVDDFNATLDSLQVAATGAQVAIVDCL